MCSPARDLNADYHAVCFFFITAFIHNQLLTSNMQWGHSSVVNPSGQVIATTDENESIVNCDVNIDDIQFIRSGIPLYTQRRFDVYNDISEGH